MRTLYSVGDLAAIIVNQSIRGSWDLNRKSLDETSDHQTDILQQASTSGVIIFNFMSVVHNNKGGVFIGALIVGDPCSWKPFQKIYGDKMMRIVIMMKISEGLTNGFVLY